MNEAHSNPPHNQGPSGQPAKDLETRRWAMFLHFSVICGWLVPLAGVLVPIIIWQLKKDELPGIVPHAHVVLNWIVSTLIYAAICFVLLLVVVGIFGFWALALATLLFSIIGGIKANDGELWEYPGTLVRVFK